MKSIDRLDLLFISTIPQRIQTGNIICIPMDVMPMQAILLNLSPGIIVSPILKSIDGNQIISFTSRGYLYVQLSPPLLSYNQRCFQVDLGSSNITGQIQFIYKTENRNSQQLETRMIFIDPCATRRVKCKNGGQCQVLYNGQTECLCPDNTSGNDCENSKLNLFRKHSNRSSNFSIVGTRCTNLVCINQAICSWDHQSCICPLGTQGRDCSTKCGESYIQPNISSDRIINGQTAVKNSWPYIVYIQIGDFGWCSGSLIDSWNVLTAAHCTYDRDIDEFILWFGVHKLDEREIEMDMGIVEKRLVSGIINHPNYNIYPIKTFENDLAILRLAEPVYETAYIRYLCILPNDNRINDVQLNDQVEIIGWGYINKVLTDGTLVRRTNELQQATIRILPDNDCMEYTNDGFVLFQSKFMICAGTKDYKTDSCQGDSGGPLLMEYNNRW